MRSARGIASVALAVLPGLLGWPAADRALAASASPSPCNAASPPPLSYVPVPGHPFSTVLSKDGCWLFASLTTSDPRSANGVALFERSGGELRLRKVFAARVRRTDLPEPDRNGDDP